MMLWFNPFLATMKHQRLFLLFPEMKTVSVVVEQWSALGLRGV